jgi:hypothetical protein
VIASLVRHRVRREPLVAAELRREQPSWNSRGMPCTALLAVFPRPSF